MCKIIVSWLLYPSKEDLHIDFKIRFYLRYYRPQTKLRKGNAPVCQSFCSRGGGGRCIPACNGPAGSVWLGECDQEVCVTGRCTPPAGQKAGGTHPTGLLPCYRPQRSCGKVMFLHLSVILFMGGSASPHTHTRANTPPPAQCMLGYGQQTGSTHPTGMQSC